MCFPVKDQNKILISRNFDAPVTIQISKTPSSGFAFGANKNPPPSNAWLWIDINETFFNGIFLTPSSSIVQSNGLRIKTFFNPIPT